MVFNPKIENARLLWYELTIDFFDLVFGGHYALVASSRVPDAFLRNFRRLDGLSRSLGGSGNTASDTPFGAACRLKSQQSFSDKRRERGTQTHNASF
ncbi:MAG: hypothetical protein GY892_24185 [Shimia sp.]|nr:hypothetical protein [Shimia sp.]